MKWLTRPIYSRLDSMLIVWTTILFMREHYIAGVVVLFVGPMLSTTLQVRAGHE